MLFRWLLVAFFLLALTAKGCGNVNRSREAPTAGELTFVEGSGSSEAVGQEATTQEPNNDVSPNEPPSPESITSTETPTDTSTEQPVTTQESSPESGPRDAGSPEQRQPPEPTQDLAPPTDNAPAPSCRDNQQNGRETDVDCGGSSCNPCSEQKRCKLSQDCQSKVCTSGRCCAPQCQQKTCGSSDGCGSTCKSGSGCKPPVLPYPTKSLYHIKGLQPDFWPNRTEVIGNNVGRIAVNLVWAHWEPSKKTPPCASNEVSFDGHCFRIQTQLDNEIKAYSAKGVVVTGVLYGVPTWARQGRVCSPVSPGFEIFCAPNNPADYARFTGMIAQRYNGNNGVGRVADFVIHNEVNSNIWFDVGCGQGTACNTNTWVQTYSANFNAAYDAITQQQPHAKVLVSLDHHFGTTYDQPSAKEPLLSGMTVLKGVAARAGNRKWRVAFHSYPPDLRRAQFSIDDFPKVTFGNLGVLAGWLRQTFPNTPSAWEIQLTENGINSISPATQQQQATALCDAFRNVLGTPGITSFIYHRMKDHPVEVQAGLAAGLFSTTSVAKPAWSVWALANRNDLTPPKLSCGFEAIPYVTLTRHHHTTRGHWASTRLPPAGFKAEKTWKILREPAAGTRLLYSCRVGQHNMLSAALNCENQGMLGPVGYVYTSQKSGTVALYRCRVGTGTDHFVSTDPNCERQTLDHLLGYVRP